MYLSISLISKPFLTNINLLLEISNAFSLVQHYYLILQKKKKYNLFLFARPLDQLSTTPHCKKVGRMLIQLCVWRFCVFLFTEVDSVTILLIIKSKKTKANMIDFFQHETTQSCRKIQRKSANDYWNYYYYLHLYLASTKAQQGWKMR